VIKSPDDTSRMYFIAGNILLACALLMLFFFVPLWERIGVFALVIWMGMAAFGVYLIMQDKRHDNLPPN